MRINPIGHRTDPAGLPGGLVIFMIFFLLPAVAGGAGDKDQPRGKIEVSEYTFDFGFMPQGVIVSHNYTVKNVGKGLLNIVKVDPTCGCTTVPVKKAFLKPGEETDLRVSFNSSKMKGNIYKHIKVLTNDPDNGLVELFIRGIIAKLPESVELSGPAVRFDGIDVKTREVRIKNVSLKKITISILPAVDDFWEANVTPRKIGPQDEAVLTIKLKKAPPLGDYKSSLTFECAGEKIERLTIPITGIGYAR